MYYSLTGSTPGTLGFSDVLALYDSELGETDLVTHTIDTGNVKCVQTSPRQLPYIF